MERAFASFVGLQPGAVAAAVRTWLAHRPGEPFARLLLLATARTRDHAKRLQAHLGDLEAKGTQVRIVPVDTSPAQGQPPAGEGVQRALDELSREKRQIVFFGDSGLGFVVARIVRGLPRDAIYLHTSGNDLACREAVGGGENWDLYPAEHIGLPRLLQLHGIRYRYQPASAQLAQLLKVSIPTARPRGLRFLDPPGPPLDVAFELRGRLFALVYVGGGRTDQMKGVVRTLQRAYSGTVLNGLQPQIAVISPSAPVRQMAERNLWPTLAVSASRSPSHREREQLARWLKYGWLGAEFMPHSGAPPATAFAAEGRWNGPPLALCLGTEPAPALASVLSHQPSRTYVFFDAGSSAVGEMAIRLASCEELSSGSVSLLPTDNLGRGIEQRLRALLNDAKDLRFDVTPGRNAQVCAAARLRGLPLWSIHRGANQAVCITQDVTPKPLRSPSVLSLAFAKGGRLLSEGLGTEVIRDQEAFWELVRSIMQREIGGPRAVPPQELEGLPDVTSLGNDRFRATDGGQAADAVVSDASLGRWLEQFAAFALLQAGADEVRVGLTWARAPEDLGPGSRDEVDVVARFGHRMLVVECEMRRGASAKETDWMERLRDETADKAANLIARLSYSAVVVSHAPGRGDTIDVASGAAVIDIALLTKTEELKKAVDTIFRTRSTM